ncbi:hypothetical protein [Dyadobacter frigoris]|uniref:Uncharacterized protein n=1 Tax=Dyadobacter frigoris TaxID=2576211 RepID=A0A4U6D2G6_9BACT|nr:hypothetical protein [Dyadobacter frigoris]TKT90347.1 hypothetical protein FDK13_21685 [Dyadobacter frigoris]
MKKIAVAAIGIACLLMVVKVRAQDKKVDQALRSELKAYILTHVQPVMKLKREILENELTELEKRQISGLRMQLAEIRKARKASNRTFMERMDGKELDETQTTMNLSERKQVRKIMMEAFSIADKHEKTIDQIGLDTRADRERWRKELKEIVIKYNGNAAGVFLARLERIGAGQSVRPALFLLWDPEKKY